MGYLMSIPPILASSDSKSLSKSETEEHPVHDGRNEIIPDTVLKWLHQVADSIYHAFANRTTGFVPHG